MALAAEFLSAHMREARRLALGATTAWTGGTGGGRRAGTQPAWWRFFYANPLYPLALAGQTPRTLRGTPPDPWPGNSTRGAAILSHEFPFAGHIVVGDEAIWQAQAGNPAWREQLHAFEWLSDLHVIGSDAARLRARSLVAAWIGRYGRWSALPWRGDIIGRRVCAWLGRYEFFCASADDAFKRRVHAGLARQVRHLMRCGGRDVAGARRIEAIKGMIYGGLYLAGLEDAAKRGLVLLENEIAAQVLPDGGHVERNPARHLAVLRHLIDIRATLLASRKAAPAALQGAIDRMAPMLRFFRHGDGRLAGFNSSGGAANWLTDMVLTRSEARGKPLRSAPHCGFQRLQANRTLIIMDTGPPTLCRDSALAHAGSLSFEMSVGRELMIVNCGGAHIGPSSWRQALRSTAAHSTLTLDAVNSSELRDDGRLGRRVAAVHCLRNEEDNHIWVDASHDGYQPDYGVSHMRRLYLSRQGDDLRGEDLLIFTGRNPQHLQGTRGFSVRFHLHPSVRASLVYNRKSALIKLPSDQGWRFHTDSGLLDLEDSVFIEADGTLRRSEQIVLSGCLTRSGASVRWALQRAVG